MSGIPPYQSGSSSFDSQVLHTHQEDQAAALLEHLAITSERLKVLEGNIEYITTQSEALEKRGKSLGATATIALGLAGALALLILENGARYACTRYLK